MPPSLQTPIKGNLKPKVHGNDGKNIPRPFTAKQVSKPYEEKKIYVPKKRPVAIQEPIQGWDDVFKNVGGKPAKPAPQVSKTTTQLVPTHA